MFHVLKDEDTIVAILANVETEQVQAAIAKVDKVYRELFEGPLGTEPHCLERALCEALGIAYTNMIDEWTDVLVALLVDGGATEVEYLWHECVPPQDEVEEVV
jgi:hypothetical protein